MSKPRRSLHAHAGNSPCVGPPDSDGGSRRTFVAALFERHRPLLAHYVERLGLHGPDLEDVLQETFVRLMNAHGLEHDAGRARAYMFRVATHLVYDRHRRPGHGRVQTLEPDAEPAETMETPEHLAELDESLAAIERGLLQLQPRCRQVFLLRVAEEQSYEAIAAILGVSKRTVEREMRHALARLQSHLEIR